MNRFPLPLVPWEEFFYYKHRPSHPATFFAYFEFSQPLQPEIAEEALRIVCGKHPLTRTIVERRAGKLYWTRAQSPTFRWCDKPVRIEDLEDGNLDINTEAGLKIWAFAGGASVLGEWQPASLQVVIHHVAFDGLGILQVLLDWLSDYQRLQQSEANQLPQEEIRELPIPRRCTSTLGLWKSICLLPGQWKSVKASLQLLRRKAIPLGTGEPLASSRPRKPRVARIQFDRETTLALKKYATVQQVSLNSILIRELLMSIDQWQTTLPRIPEGTHLRIMIPIDERRREHRHSTACNHCSMINLDRTGEEVRNPAALLASIEQEMGVIQKWKLSLNFWRALSIFRWLPNGLQRFQSSEVAATASLTNLGRLRLTSKVATRLVDQPASGNPLRLINFEIVAPLMHGTMAAFAVAFLHGELKLTLQYDPHHISDVQAKELMERFRERLNENVRSSIA